MKIIYLKKIYKLLPNVLQKQVKEIYKKFVFRKIQNEIDIDLGLSILKKTDIMTDYPTTKPSLPFKYLTDLLSWLKNENYQFITYENIFNNKFLSDYSIEFQNWIKNNKDKKSILLHYDVDANPSVTMNLIKIHIKEKIPATVMIFNKKIFDWKLKKNNILEYDENYIIDFDLLKKFEKVGGQIGYHCNAYDRSMCNETEALKIFERDISDLRRRGLKINYFSMHGGKVSKDGKSNSTLNVHKLSKKLGLSWVHNGNSPYFHLNFADGGASNINYINECNDLLDLILATNNSNRTRILLHPQYYHNYHNDNFNFPVLSKTEFYKSSKRFYTNKKNINKNYWNYRKEVFNKKLERSEKLFQYDKNESPIFVSGMSRSGTTLMVSILNAHKNISMAVESYPRYLLEPSGEQIQLTAEESIYVSYILRNYNEDLVFNILSADPFKNMAIFAAVSTWTGLTLNEIGYILFAHFKKHHRVNSILDAFSIINATLKFKMKKEKTKIWGSKCQSNYSDYQNAWPTSKFVYIIRNGLDILSSQKNTGSFKPDPFNLGRNWVQSYEKFLKCKNGIIINYEKLVTEPSKTIKNLCKDLNISYDPKMLDFYKLKTPLSKNHRGQLSAKRVEMPIDSSQINRWKKDLTKNEIKKFIDGAGGADLFKKYSLEYKI